MFWSSGSPMSSPMNPNSALRREWIPAALLLALLATVRVTSPDSHSTTQPATAAKFVDKNFRALFASEDQIYGVRRTLANHCLTDERVLCSSAQRNEQPRCSRDNDPPIDPPFISMLDIHSNPYECELNLEVAGNKFPSEKLFDYAAHKDMALYHVIAYLIEIMTRHVYMIDNKDLPATKKMIHKYNQLMISSFIEFFSNKETYGSKPLTINIIDRKDHGHFHHPTKHIPGPNTQFIDAPTFQYIERRNNYHPNDIMKAINDVMDYYKLQTEGGHLVNNIDSTLVMSSDRMRLGYEQNILPDLKKVVEPCCSIPVVEKTKNIVPLFLDEHKKHAHNHHKDSLSVSNENKRRVFEKEPVDQCMQYHYYRGTLLSDDCAQAMLAGASRIQQLEYQPSHLRSKSHEGRWCVWFSLSAVCLIGILFSVVWIRLKSLEMQACQIAVGNNALRHYMPLSPDQTMTAAAPQPQIDAENVVETQFANVPTKNEHTGSMALLRFTRIGLIIVWFVAFVAWMVCHSVHRNDWIDSSMITIFAFLLTYLIRPTVPETPSNTDGMELSLVQSFD